MGQLTAHGHELTPHPGDAEVIVVNTCSFIDPAKQESIDTILEMAEYKKTGRAQRLGPFLPVGDPGPSQFVSLALGPLIVPGGSARIQLRSVVFAVTLSLLFNVLGGANQLLGLRVLFNFVSGRYHRPRIEARGRHHHLPAARMGSYPKS